LKGRKSACETLGFPFNDMFLNSPHLRLISPSFLCSSSFSSTTNIKIRGTQVYLKGEAEAV
jgi:hypothetical protein